MTDPDHWLTEYIAQSRRSARRALCPKCGARTLVGDDHDRCALRARVDATSVDRLREVVAKLRGLSTYDAVPRAGFLDLYYREREHVLSVRRRYPVHVQHRCPTKESD